MQKASTMSEVSSYLNKITKDTNCIIFFGEPENFLTSKDAFILNYLTDGVLAKKNSITHGESFVTNHFQSKLLLLFCDLNQINQISHLLEKNLVLFEKYSVGKKVICFGQKDFALLEKHISSFLAKAQFTLII